MAQIYLYIEQEDTEGTDARRMRNMGQAHNSDGLAKLLQDYAQRTGKKSFLLKEVTG